MKHCFFLLLFFLNLSFSFCKKVEEKVMSCFEELTFLSFFFSFKKLKLVSPLKSKKNRKMHLVVFLKTPQENRKNQTSNFK